MSPVVLTEVERAGDKAAYQNTTASEREGKLNLTTAAIRC